MWRVIDCRLEERTTGWVGAAAAAAAAERSWCREVSVQEEREGWRRFIGAGGSTN